MSRAIEHLAHRADVHALRNAPVLVLDDPVELARAVELRYVCDEQPGLRRRRCGQGFVYADEHGKRITDPELCQRFRSLVIPPGWTNVWICPDPNGHIQVTGRDDLGRKQYIYHPRWEELRNQKKFERMIPFGHSLPGLRAHLDADLRRRYLPREKVLALVIKLLEETLIRVGNEQYTRQNGSYGLTTLCDRHIDVHGSLVHFEFRGKSGVARAVDICDRRLARLVKECQELPGQRLFQYLDDDSLPQSVGSSDVNAYLREIMGAPITAKDFRTWGGTVTALRVFHELGPCEDEKQHKRNVVAAIKYVARKLGNTPTVCRSYYVHPAVLHAYTDQSLFRVMHRATRHRPRSSYDLHVEERALLSLLGD
ncbi:MAG TPA: DNA topoisomerase IB [Haliangium sp.]|nr:DNA topoisomerase IB [Haliangium sp.]